MSSEKETLQRVQGALYHLRRGLAPFVETRMKARYGAQWLANASRAAGGDPRASLDEYGMLKTMIDQWRDVFDEAFVRSEKQRVRTFVSTALDARNATAHLSIPMQDNEALRYLDAVDNLLRAVKAPEAEIAEARRLYDDQRRQGIGPQTPTGVSLAPKGTPAPTLMQELPDDRPGKGPRPWIEIALPHPDVLANRFKEAEFAADLFAVDAGIAGEGYATPLSFFAMTFVTEGLKRVLTSALQRLSNQGGDPVIGLQTAFGGGKTHTMLAVYHLARHLRDAGDPAALSGLTPSVGTVGATGWPKPQIAVFVGSSKGTDVSLTLRDGPKLHTLWGYLAWRLAGEVGLKLVAEAEAARTNPGSELMVEVFRLAGPSVILLDELVMFARQLDDARFEAFLSFLQSLTEAAKMVPGILVIGSLPESDAEAGGERGKEALLRLEKVFGRVQSAWLPASGDETYEIIRRRLFQPLNAEGERARDETVKAFADLYRKNPAEFPPEAREARYTELLRLSYPIHPELFDRLSKDWASLDKFQRTRGVLRFMANVVGVLWHQRVPDALIMPARVPVAHERVRASVLYPLDAAFGAVVDKEVDGDSSLPSRMEANPSRRISQAHAATRAARAVFLCSAPLVRQPNAGLTGQGLRLACAEPGDQLAIFGEALRELSERATYLYEEAGRYWFSTQPTLNRLAEDRAKALAEHEVDEAIAQVLRDDGASKDRFHRVFAVPDDPITIDEVQALSLMILGPTTPHAGKGVAKSAAIEAVTDALSRCRASQRRFRNTLLFVAADEALLGTAREAMRRALSWETIGADPRQDKRADKRLQDQLTQAQLADARDKARNSRDGAVKAVRNAWSHVLYPIKTNGTEAGRAFDLEHLSLTAKDRASVPTAVYEKAKSDGIVSEKLGADALWLHLAPLWAANDPHLPVAEIAAWFATYVYLPKLRDRVVLDAAICDACAKLSPAFAFAERFDEANGRYIGLVWQKAPYEILPATSLLVRPDVAITQLRPATMPTQPVTIEGSQNGISGPTDDRPTTTDSEPPGKVRPRRFYGSVEIDMVRPVKAFDAILNAVVMELLRTHGAQVTLTLEIEATAPDGFSDGDIGVVRDNSRQLKFKPESTGFE
ncbi:DUF499 domain-containing protein [Acidiphilium sp.]|uniref:DUF499 domain-containing protein n=1 Tax=Acidiphilium sp. TaxID=527 RepID=UPI00258DB4EB|nr:DUF499 domain-containing protein [Acidiphilium sp.]